MFKLYYLIDQDGDMNGDKEFQADFNDLASAQAKAVADAVAHYSVEQDQNNGAVFSIVFIQ